MVSSQTTSRFTTIQGLSLCLHYSVDFSLSLSLVTHFGSCFVQVSNKIPFESRVYWKWPLYPTKAAVRSMHILPPPIPLVGLHWICCCFNVPVKWAQLDHASSTDILLFCIIWLCCSALREPIKYHKSIKYMLADL